MPIEGRDEWLAAVWQPADPLPTPQHVLRARSGLTTEQLIYRGRADGWLVVPSLDPE